MSEEAAEKISSAYQLIRERGDDGVWISILSEAEALSHVSEVEGAPLYGQTFAIKDNIDLFGLPTTAACPDFSYDPSASAVVVQRLIAAGAIPFGKTNLDQFATGLNGTRTPYTMPRNAIDDRYISGGSSSGSAVAVAAGLVDFALGTDTAGSGRVPAAFHNLVGYKPTKGRWSTTGLVPACRTLDCITVLTRTVAESAKIDAIVKGFDPADAYSRPEMTAKFLQNPPRLGVLPASEREFFGDTEYARLYEEAIAKAVSLGWLVEEFDYTPFRQAADLLYSAPWVAERQAAVGAFMHEKAESIHPVVRRILQGADGFSAVDTFNGQYRLAALARQTEATWKSVDALLLPTTGTIYTIEQMLADPIKLNSNLGRYTNFMNLLDLCGIAVPAGFRADGMPFGVTFFAPAWQDAALFELGAAFVGEEPSVVATGIKLGVVGAHLRGQPLNHQLIQLGARFVSQTETAPRYALHALDGVVPAKPGMVRVPEGVAVEIEVWELSAESFGKFVTALPFPMCIGSVELASGEWVKGFLCEQAGLSGARDISSLGSWRKYLALGQ